MEWLIIFVIVCSYSSLSSKIDKLIKKQIATENKKTFSSLNKLLGKKVSLELGNDADVNYDYETKGILKDFNDKWLILETENRKKEKELLYYRLNNVGSIDIIEEKK